MNPTNQVLNIIDSTAEMLREAEKLYKYYYPLVKNPIHKRKYLATHLLDYILTQVPAENLKQFKNYRKKGFI